MRSDLVRLAFLIGRLESGGAELQMIALTPRLLAQGFQVDIVTRTGAGPLDERARAAGASVRHTGDLASGETPALTRMTRLAGRTARWVAIARHHRYDVVDAWLHPADMVAALTRPLTGVPVVVSARLGRGARVRVGPATGVLERAVTRLTDAVVANSDLTAADARDEQGIPASKVHVIRGGVELPSIDPSPDREHQRAAMGVREDEFLIGCVGNFRKMKRHDLLLDAFGSLLADHRDIRLVLVGDGDLRGAIERRVRSLGLERHVILFGTALDTRPLYRAFDLFVQASNDEGLPNVLLEASAARLPIVATSAGGSGEVVHDGETGLLVPIDDVGALAAGMRQAMSDADLRTRMGAAARNLIEREYGMDRFAREYAALYRRLLAMDG